MVLDFGSVIANRWNCSPFFLFRLLRLKLRKNVDQFRSRILFWFSVLVFSVYYENLFELSNMPYAIYLMSRIRKSHGLGVLSLSVSVSLRQLLKMLNEGHRNQSVMHCVAVMTIINHIVICLICFVAKLAFRWRFARISVMQFAWSEAFILPRAR